MTDFTEWNPPAGRWPAMAAALLAWHRPEQRTMPWRQNRTPYRTWVAEVMLHQTQVQTVVPYYERFLARFPTVESLAAAALDDVLKAWEGLGYYARARNLHRGARQVVEGFGGQLPQTADELIRISGIGRYTAGAILSTAFGQDQPAVDGNVTRVLCRVFDIDTPPQGATAELLWTLAEALLPHGQAGDFNEALMDLGATVCTPRKPDCARCPWASDCQANRLGLQAARPVRRPRRTIPHYDIAIGVIWHGDGVLISRRPPEALLGGLWEFPGGKIELGESPADALTREAGEELDIRVDDIQPFMIVQHAYTHFRVTLHVLQCRHVSGEPQCRACTDWRWEQVANLARYAFPTANRKIIAALLQETPPIGRLWVERLAVDSLRPTSEHQEGI